MKLALIGYGKMGRLVEKIALDRGHEIAARIHPSGSSKSISEEALESAEVCIDFSHPSVVMNNIHSVIRCRKNLVVGTTGWEEHREAVEKLVLESQIGLIHSPNFSLGVNLFFQIVTAAAELLPLLQNYDLAVFEAHHKEKADSPSGTAKALAEILRQHLNRKAEMCSLRFGSLPGTHQVLVDAPSETITLTHQAKNRNGFALGAVIAAEWLRGKSGFYSMDHLLGSECMK